MSVSRVLIIFAIIVLICILAAVVTRTVWSQETIIFVPRICIVSLYLTDKTTCEGKDMEHMVCHGVKMVEIKGCEQVRVK